MRTWALFLFALSACSDPRGSELLDASSDAAGDAADAVAADVSSLDAGVPDAQHIDAVFDVVPVDGGSTGNDGGLTDGGVSDTGPIVDAATDASGRDSGDVVDAGFDAGHDAGFDAGHDAGALDAGHDAGALDAGPTGCVSGAGGNHVVRFTWQGSGSGSTAYVSYDANSLPDTSVWRVSAASGSIGYRPVFSDIFLGEGGLEVGSGVFIDVQLSTLGLTSVTGLTIAVYGRSFNTTSPGSFTWQSFEGTGASPTGNVSNSAPYEWYSTDATGAITAGDDGVRLRLRAGPPSNRLIIRRVEICFTAS